MPRIDRVARALHAGPHLRQRHDRVARQRRARRDAREDGRSEGGGEVASAHGRRHCSARIRGGWIPTCRRTSRYRPGSTPTWPPGAATSATRSSRCSADDAAYAYHPYDEPLRGAEAVAGLWLEDQDAPGTWEAAYAPALIAGHEAIVTGETRYTDGQVFSNLWQLDFAPTGAARASSSGTCSGPRRAEFTDKKNLLDKHSCR